MKDDLIAYAFLALGCGGFLTLGFQIVYGICDAESLMPAWLELLALHVVQARDRVLLALANAALAVALRLNSPNGATR